MATPHTIVVLPGSLRKESFSLKIAKAFAKLAPDTLKLNVVTLNDISFFNQDLEANPPADWLAFRETIQKSDGVLFVTPEYNRSMPGVLKNAIDWASRFQPQPFNERHGLLMSASPSMAGGNRGLWALRVPLEHLGARVYPDMFSLAQAHRAFTAEGRLADEQLQQRFDTNVINFLDLVEASTHYPCVKRAWVEYLGEHPEPVLDRVE